MSFNTDVNIDDFDFFQNPYLADARQGLALVSALLSGSTEVRDRSINTIVDEMITACGRLRLPEGNKYFAKFRQLVDLLKIPVRNKILRGYTIVGFGGQFSSGKSSVLNSLMEEGAEFRLPENTLASTSVSTYLLHGQQEQVTVCTKNNKEVHIDATALEAVSHEFNRVYSFNMAQYIDFISVSLPQFCVKKIALLDTPGYNASDVATRQESMDRMRSLKALRSVDHLVWLISAKEPLLNRTDAAFIRSLNVSGAVTVVVNKTDQVGHIFQSSNPDNCDDLAHIRRGFEEAGIACDAVIPYCAREPEWNDGRRKLLCFLEKAAASESYAEDRGAQLENIIEELRHEFQNMLKSVHLAEMETIDAVLDAIFNPLEIQSLVSLRGLMGFERINLRNDYSTFETCATHLSQWIKRQQSLLM